MPDPIRVELSVTPDRVSPADLDELRVRVAVTNESDEPVDLELPSSTLLVDGKPSLNWSLAIGNGARDEREYALPAGESVSAERVMGGSLVREPGEHEVTIEVLGVRSAPVRVVVEP